ncbi:MAG: glycosyltransferase family 4 protein [Acidobacteriia bacterium]|nr:glycosyltransferase family 4 protein [Terriglobia bacterium]
MRILILSASYSPVLGGLQTATRALARHLVEKGQRVVVVTNRYPRSLPPQETIDGVSVRRWLFLTPGLEHLRRGRPDLLAASSYFYPATLHQLGRLMGDFQPDVVNVHFPDNQIPHVLWARRRFAFRLVVSLHGNDVERWSSMETRTDAGSTGFKSLLRDADAVTACSRYLLRQAAKVESSITPKAHVIHNGIDLERFEDRSCYPHPRPYLLAYGRLVYQKGFDLLVRAFAQIAPMYPDLDLIIAGEGAERNELERLSAQSGVGSRVYFQGRASQPEIIRLLNGCRLVAVPSRHESFGIVALEALAAGRPVLATRVGGLPEVTEGAPVNLVEPAVEDLVAGLNEMLSETPFSGGRAPRSRISTASWPEVAERYLQLYSQLVSPERVLCSAV